MSKRYGRQQRKKMRNTIAKQKEFLRQYWEITANNQIAIENLMRQVVSVSLERDALQAELEKLKCTS